MSAQHSSSGIGICAALFLIFLVLKLAGVISWPWWLVTSPLWIPWVLLIGFVGLLMVVSVIVTGIMLLFGGRK